MVQRVNPLSTASMFQATERASQNSASLQNQGLSGIANALRGAGKRYSKNYATEGDQNLDNYAAALQNAIDPSSVDQSTFGHLDQGAATDALDTRVNTLRDLSRQKVTDDRVTKTFEQGQLDRKDNLADKKQQREIGLFNFGLAKKAEDRRINVESVDNLLQGAVNKAKGDRSSFDRLTKRILDNSNLSSSEKNALQLQSDANYIKSVAPSAEDKLVIDTQMATNQAELETLTGEQRVMEDQLAAATGWSSAAFDMKDDNSVPVKDVLDQYESMYADNGGLSPLAAQKLINNKLGYKATGAELELLMNKGIGTNGVFFGYELESDTLEDAVDDYKAKILDTSPGSAATAFRNFKASTAKSRENLEAKHATWMRDMKKEAGKRKFRDAANQPALPNQAADFGVPSREQFNLLMEQFTNATKNKGLTPFNRVKR